MASDRAGLIFDWNRSGGGVGRPRGGLSFDDETLRDGLQSPSVRNPSLGEKVTLLHLMAAVGITSADVGMPGAGGRAASDCEALCREIAAARLPIVPNCAARTVPSDVGPIVEIGQRTGVAIEVALFIGSSPIRCRVEGWTLDELVERTERCVGLAVEGGARVTFVTEDTTRSHPETLRRLCLAAVNAGATRICLADTAGHATPITVIRVVRFARQVLAGIAGGPYGIDWHGHNDRGLAVANALTAAWAGADRLHATALGVGERVGNPPMEQLLVNARIEGWTDADLARVPEYVAAASRMLGVTVPPAAPMVGRDAFRTATGVHAAAILKAEAGGEDWLVDLVYSAVPASWLGRRQEVEVGPVAGASNVRHWLRAHGYAEDPDRVARMVGAAKASDHTLSDAELHALAVG